MQVFGKFIIVVCLALLTWRQIELAVEWEIGTLILVAVALSTIVLTFRSRRGGYWLAVLMGVGFLTELLLVADPLTQLVHLQSLMLWGGALVASGAMLLWSSSGTKRRKPVYERHVEYY